MTAHAIPQESLEPHEDHDGNIHRLRVRVTVPVDVVVEVNGDEIEEVHLAKLDGELLTYKQCLFIADECAGEIWDQIPN